MGSGMVLTAVEEYPERIRGSSSLMVRRSEILEGLLNYRGRSQASCIYMRIQGNRGHGISKEQLKYAECKRECERTVSNFRRAQNENPR